MTTEKLVCPVCEKEPIYELERYFVPKNELRVILSCTDDDDESLYLPTHTLKVWGQTKQEARDNWIKAFGAMTKDHESDYKCTICDEKPTS